LNFRNTWRCEINFKPRAHHSYGIEDARLIVKNELAWKQVKNFAIGRQRNGTRTIDCAAYIFARNFAHPIAEAQTTVGIKSAYVRSAHAYRALHNIESRHALGLLTCGTRRTRCRSQFANEPLAHSG